MYGHGGFCFLCDMDRLMALREILLQLARVAFEMFETVRNESPD